jgi:hypothetical protein
MRVRLPSATTAAMFVFASACGKPFGDAAPPPAPPDAGAAAPADAGDGGGFGGPSRCTDGLFGTPVQADDLRLSGEELGLWLSVDQDRAYVAGRRVPASDPDVLLWTRSAPDRPFDSGPSLPVQLQVINDTAATTRVAFTPDELTVVVEYEEATARYLRAARRKSTSDDFAKPTNIVFATVAGDTEATGLGEDPFIQHDGKALFFIRADVNGDRRIHVAAARDADSWGRPLALDLGTARQIDDASPVVSHDGLTLFFASARDSGTRLGIYMRDRANPNVMFEGTAQSLGPDVDSAADDYPVAVSNDACTLFFVSRRGASGTAHVWKTQRTR